MKYTEHPEGHVTSENEIVVAAKALLAAMERVGKGELKDSVVELRAMAEERPRDARLLFDVAHEVEARLRGDRRFG